MQLSDFQKRLKEETLEIHKEAENHHVMQSFIKGTFSKNHLLAFLANIRPIYDVVELRLLQPYIFDNAELKRTVKIDKDIALLSKEVPKDILPKLLTPLECTDLWVAWCWSKPVEMLKSELYVRWLADLYGGRMISKNIGKFNNSVEFKDPGKIISDIRNILDTENLIINEQALIDDIIEFFDYHLDLFDTIQEDYE